MRKTNLAQKSRKFNASNDIENCSFENEHHVAPMKKLSPIIAVMALALATYLWIALSRAQNQLRLMEQKTAGLDALQAKLATSRAMQKAVEEARLRQAVIIRRIQDDKTALNRPVERVAQQYDTGHGDTAPVSLGKEAEVLGDGTLVYGPEARIQLPNGIIISSPSGVMVSDASRTHIDGDLLIDSPNGQLLAGNAFLTFENGKMNYKADSLTRVGPVPTR
jgi:hypothetical protein